MYRTAESSRVQSEAAVHNGHRRTIINSAAECTRAVADDQTIGAASSSTAEYRPALAAGHVGLQHRMAQSDCRADPVHDRAADAVDRPVGGQTAVDDGNIAVKVDEPAAIIGCVCCDKGVGQKQPGVAVCINSAALITLADHGVISDCALGQSQHTAIVVNSAAAHHAGVTQHTRIDELESAIHISYSTAVVLRVTVLQGNAAHD